MHAYIHIHVHMHVYIHIHIYIYIDINIYRYIYILYIYTCMSYITYHKSYINTSITVSDQPRKLEPGLRSMGAQASYTLGWGHKDAATFRVRCTWFYGLAFRYAHDIMWEMEIGSRS